MWYNRKHGKTGTLWEGRFKSQLVQEGYAAKMTAAYIDLNPVRAGMVKDPKDYRWCSYGEAIAGGKRAQQGLLEVMNKHEKGILIEENNQLTWGDVMGEYRMILAEEGKAEDQDLPVVEGQNREKTKKKRYGFSKEEVEKIKEKEGKLSWSELLRCRTRHFTEGLVIGTKEYVDSFFQNLKAKTGNYQKRKSGARKIKKLVETEVKLCTMRDLGS
jgi:putative transposase